MRYTHRDRPLDYTPLTPLDDARYARHSALADWALVAGGLLSFVLLLVAFGA